VPHEQKRTDEDFIREFLKLRERAREHGFNPNTWHAYDFLYALAEARAEDVATIRHLYNIINERVVSEFRQGELK
jgi:hypothetical protein